jgi:hypothetical protein
MVSDPWTITSLFAPSAEKKDCGTTDVISQINQFKGFEDGASGKEQEYINTL